MSSRDLRSAGERRLSPEFSSVSSVSMPYFALSSCISRTSCGSLTFQRKMTREISISALTAVKNSV